MITLGGIGLTGGISADAAPTRASMGRGVEVHAAKLRPLLDPCHLSYEQMKDAELAVNEAQMELYMCQFWSDATGGGDCSEQEAALEDAQSVATAAVGNWLLCNSMEHG